MALGQPAGPGMPSDGPKARSVGHVMTRACDEAVIKVWVEHQGAAMPSVPIPGVHVPGGATPNAAIPGEAIPGGAIAGGAVPGGAIMVGRSQVGRPTWLVSSDVHGDARSRQ
jgi:hypothetical protein